MKQRIMKWITFSLVLALSLSLAACSGGASSSGASSAPASAGGSTAASEADVYKRQGFTRGIRTGTGNGWHRYC